MKTETLMWLLPIVFMVHDFEEIIMLQPWLRHNANSLQERFPQLASRFLPHFEKLSTGSFSLAVAEEFILLSAATYLTVEWSLYSVWAGILLAFSIHLISHILQFVFLRRYTPAIITSISTGAFCLGALYYLSMAGKLVWSEVVLWSIIALAVILANLLLMHLLAERFEGYLKASFQPE